MATNYPYARRRLDGGVVRDVIALILILACVIGCSVVAFATDWRLGVLILSLAAGAVGAYLAYER